jgi:hypothetical protein
VQQPDLQALRDQVLGVAEGDPVVRRRDAEDVRALGGVHEPSAAVIGDADGTWSRFAIPQVASTVPSVTIATAPSLARRVCIDGLPGGEVVVIELHREVVRVRADDDSTARVEVVRGERDAVADRLGDVGAAADRDVDGDHDLPAGGTRALAATGREEGNASEEQDGSAHGLGSLQTLCPEVRLAHDVAVGDLGDRALGDGAARGGHHDAVCREADKTQVVLDQQQRNPTVPNPAHNLGDASQLLASRSGGKLVDEDHVRLRGERSRQRYQSALRGRELGSRDVGEVVEPDERERLVGLRLVDG